MVGSYLSAEAMKGYSAFPKAPVLLEPHIRLFYVSYPGHSLGETYPSSEMQSVYSTTPANWASIICNCIITKIILIMLKYLFLGYGHKSNRMF